MEFIQKDRKFDTIKTSRCTLQLISQKNAQDILKTCTLDVCEYFDFPIHQNIEGIEKQIDEWIQETKNKTCLNFAIYNEDGLFIGDTEIRHIDTGNISMGIRLGTSYQQKGYGAEVIPALVDRVKNNLLFNFIRRDCYKDNVGSIKIIEKLGGVLYEKKKTKHWKYGEIDDYAYRIYPKNN